MNLYNTGKAMLAATVVGCAATPKAYEQSTPSYDQIGGIRVSRDPNCSVGFGFEDPKGQHWDRVPARTVEQVTANGRTSKIVGITGRGFELVRTKCVGRFQAPGSPAIRAMESNVGLRWVTRKNLAAVRAAATQATKVQAKAVQSALYGGR